MKHNTNASDTGYLVPAPKEQVGHIVRAPKERGWKRVKPLREEMGFITPAPKRGLSKRVTNEVIFYVFTAVLGTAVFAGLCDNPAIASVALLVAMLIAIAHPCDK